MGHHKRFYEVLFMYDINKQKKPHTSAGFCYLNKLKPIKISEDVPPS